MVLRIVLCVWIAWCAMALAGPENLLAFENRIKVPKDAPYGLGAVLLSLSEHGPVVLLPGRVAPMHEQGVFVIKAVVQTKHLGDGSFEKTILPKKCRGGLGDGYKRIYTGEYKQGRIEELSCHARRLK